jgi:hypothetical protein
MEIWNPANRCWNHSCNDDDDDGFGRKSRVSCFACGAGDSGGRSFRTLTDFRVEGRGSERDRWEIDGHRLWIGRPSFSKTFLAVTFGRELESKIDIFSKNILKKNFTDLNLKIRLKKLVIMKTFLFQVFKFYSVKKVCNIYGRFEFNINAS